MTFSKETFLYTKMAYQKGDVLMRLGSTKCQEDDSSRIQVDASTFILPPKLLAHSCEPNAYIDWFTMELKALRSISKGSLVTYHYATSEDDYCIGQFRCECGSTNCIGEFCGFMFLPDKERQRIEPFISPYLREKYYG